MAPPSKKARTDPSIPHEDIEDVNDFPSKVLRIIFSHLDQLKTASRVCRQWRDLALGMFPERYMLTIHGSSVAGTRQLAAMLPESTRIYQTVSLQLGEFGPTRLAAAEESFTNICTCLTILLEKGTVRNLRLVASPDFNMVRLFVMNHAFFNSLEELSVSVFNKSVAGATVTKMEGHTADVPLARLKSLKWEEFDDYSQIEFGNTLFIFTIPSATKVELIRREGLTSRSQSLAEIRRCDNLQQLTIPNMDEHFAKEFFSANRPNLKHLELKESLFIAPPQALQSLAQNLPQLETLSFGRVDTYFEQEISLARQFRNLTSLSLMTHKITLSELIEALAPLISLQKLLVDCEEDCQPGRSTSLMLPNLVDFNIEVHYYSPNGKQIQLIAPNLRKFHIFNACDDRKDKRVPSVRIAAIDQPHLSDLKFHWCSLYLQLFRQQKFTELRKWTCTIWDPEPELAAQIDARFSNLQHLTLSLYNYRDEHMDNMMANVFTHCRDLRFLELEFFAMSFPVFSGIEQCENLAELRLKEGTIEGVCDRFLTLKRLQRLTLANLVVEDEQLHWFAVRTRVFIYRYKNNARGDALYCTTRCSEERLDAFFEVPTRNLHEQLLWTADRVTNPLPPLSKENMKLARGKPKEWQIEPTKNFQGSFWRSTVLGPDWDRVPLNSMKKNMINPSDSESDSDGWLDSDEEPDSEYARRVWLEKEALDEELEALMARARAVGNPEEQEEDEEEEGEEEEEEGEEEEDELDVQMEGDMLRVRSIRRRE